MAFGRGITKEDLVAAGLDPDKFTALIGTSVTKDELTALKTEFTTSLQGIKDSLAELTTKLTTRSNTDDGNNGGNNNDNRDNNGNGNGNGNGNNRETPDIFAVDPIEFATDPATHLRKISAAVVNDARVNAMAIRRDNAYDRLSTSLPWFKNQTIREEVDTKWKKYTAATMVQFNLDPMSALREIYDSVVGAHYDDIIRDRDKKDGKFNMIQTGGSNRQDNNDGASNDIPAEKLLSVEELKAAASFGMTPEEWVKEQNALVSAGKYVRQ